jgi:hypothetical protein
MLWFIAAIAFPSAIVVAIKAGSRGWKVAILVAGLVGVLVGASGGTLFVISEWRPGLWLDKLFAIIAPTFVFGFWCGAIGAVTHFLQRRLMRRS